MERQNPRVIMNLSQEAILNDRSGLQFLRDASSPPMIDERICLAVNNFYDGRLILPRGKSALYDYML